MCVFRDSLKVSWMALFCCSHFNWLLAPQPRLKGESFRDLSLSQRIVGCRCRRNCIPVSIQWLVWVGWCKSITVIIMTMGANSTATSAILKPSAAPAYQGVPWDQQEATPVGKIYTYSTPQANTFRTLFGEAVTGMNQHISKISSFTQQISLSDTLCGETFVCIIDTN